MPSPLKMCYQALKDKTNLHWKMEWVKYGLCTCFVVIFTLVDKPDLNEMWTFKVVFYHEGQGKSPSKIDILTNVFCTSSPNLVILAWTGDELSHGQSRLTCTHTHGQTGAGNDNNDEILWYYKIAHVSSQSIKGVLQHDGLYKHIAI